MAKNQYGIDPTAKPHCEVRGTGSFRVRRLRLANLIMTNGGEPQQLGYIKFYPLGPANQP
jgi:hypothetical protein